MKAEGNENDSIFLCRKAVLSPIKELDELVVLERHTSLDRDSGSSNTEVRVAKTVADPTFPGLVVSDDDRKTWGPCLSQRNPTPDAPPIWIPSFPQLPTLPTSLQVDIPVTPERRKKIHWLLASPDHVPERPSYRIDPLPIFARITLPRFSLSPSGIHKVFDPRLASSEPGSDQSNKEVGNAAPDLLLDGLLVSSAQNGEINSTGDLCSKRTWNASRLRSSPSP
jgi:hypothetical protein